MSLNFVFQITSVDTITPYTSACTFEELNLIPELLKGLYVEMKYERPSKIQAISLPMILYPPYLDLIAQAHCLLYSRNLISYRSDIKSSSSILYLSYQRIGYSGLVSTDLNFQIRFSVSMDLNFLLWSFISGYVWLFWLLRFSFLIMILNFDILMKFDLYLSSPFWMDSFGSLDLILCIEFIYYNEI